MFKRCIDFVTALYYAIFGRFVKNRRGIAALVIGLVVALVACSVILAVGLMIHSNLSTSLSVVTTKTNETSTAENITYDVFANVYSAYNLSSVVPLIAGAALIITIIVGAFALRGRMR
jgi:Flp pilus assembly pilin Flp